MTATPSKSEQVQVLRYIDLIGLVRGRVADLDVPHEQLEEYMDLTPGHLGKILGVAEIRRIGLASIWKILDGLGLRMIIVEHLDRAATLDEMAAKTRPRKRKGPPRGKLRMTMSPAVIHAAAQRYGAMGAGKRKTFRSEKVKVKQRQNASRCRWKKYRLAMAAR